LEKCSNSCLLGVAVATPKIAQGGFDHSFLVGDGMLHIPYGGRELLDVVAAVLTVLDDGAHADGVHRVGVHLRPNVSLPSAQSILSVGTSNG